MFKKISICLASILILDGLWLGLIAGQFYQSHLKSFLTVTEQGMRFNIASATLVYVFLTIGILCFPVSRANGVTISAILWGAVFGLCTYGTYGFTNHAIIESWPLNVSAIDTLWGAFLCATTSFLVTKFS